MPTLPSGRRIEFSLDRFHALLNVLPPAHARRIAAQLVDADDLLWVMDAVHFSLVDSSPYFAGYVAADWATYVADWNTADRQSLQTWFVSPEACETRVEAIDYIRGLVLGGGAGCLAYPYLEQDATPPTALAASPLRQ